MGGVQSVNREGGCMIMIGIGNFPHESSRQMINIMSELPEVPGYIQLHGPYFNTSLGKGVEFITVYEFDVTNYAQVMENIRKRYSIFTNVLGFSYSLNEWLKMADALKMVGLAGGPE